MHTLGSTVQTLSKMWQHFYPANNINSCNLPGPGKCIHITFNQLTFDEPVDLA